MFTGPGSYNAHEVFAKLKSNPTPQIMVNRLFNILETSVFDSTETELGLLDGGRLDKIRTCFRKQ